MVYVQRKNGIVVGLFAQRTVLTDADPLADDHSEVVAYLNPPPEPRLVQDEAERQAVRTDAALTALVNATPGEIDTWVASNFPTLIAPGEKARLAMIVKILAVAVRPHVR